MFFILFGIVANFLSIYSISYFQKVLDAFQVGDLTIKLIFVYGMIMIVTCIVNYFDTYPEQN